MISNALLAPRSAASSGITPGYRDAIAGLRSFDELSRTLGRQRDTILRGVTKAAAYPQPAHGASAASGSALGSAVAAFVGSESGRAAIERALSGVGSFVKGLLGEGGAVQLPLPFE